MKLRDLLSDDAAPGAGEIAVSGLAVDSRQVKRGDVFFALAGAKTDGANSSTRRSQTARSLCRRTCAAGRDRVPFIKVANARRALALAAARFYPRQPQTIAAVTGTSGKTSVAAFTRQIWMQRRF